MQVSAGLTQNPLKVHMRLVWWRCRSTD